MISSSEQLFEQEQNEARKLYIKKKQLDPKKKKNAAKPVPRTMREQVRFYTTSVLAFFSVTFGASLLFLVPLYVDPAISTLVSDFSEEPTLCTTTRREDVVGINNCSWSSCREGCTSDMFKCIHVFVTYVEDLNLTAGVPANLTHAELVNITADMPQSEEAMLLVNIKGCGYPPSVTCKNFSERYGVEGAIFPCHYSRVNRTVVLTSYNRQAQIAIIVHFFAIPFAITVASSVALCCMHCDCRFQKERRKVRRRSGGCEGHSHGEESDDMDGRSYGSRSAGGGAGVGGGGGGAAMLGRGGMPGARQRPFVENLSDSSISTRVDMLTPAIEVYRPPL